MRNVLTNRFACKMPPKNRTALTLEQRIDVINKSEKGKLSARNISDHFGVGRSQSNSVLKRIADVLADFDNNVSAERKRQKKATGNDDINKLLWEWFKNATSRRINLSGPLIKEKALKFAQDFGVESFKASNGWLESFKHRHNIVMGTMSGERGDVSNDTVNDWKSKLPTVCEGYTPQDIFNMDETGLFYRDTPKSTFKVNGEECTGGKRSKERLTIALCASMTGEKLPALVIGKCKKPRCFKNITPKALPVIYTSNKRAWMNSALFQWWLETFNRKI